MITDTTELIESYLNKNYKLGTTELLNKWEQAISILNLTSFIPLEKLNTIDDLLLNKRIWHIKNNILNVPYCQKCKNEFKFINFVKGYMTTCIRCEGVPNRIKTTESKILNQLTQSNFEMVSSYTGRLNSTMFKCKTCGHIFDKVLRNGSNFKFCCPKCTPYRSSQEDIIKEFIASNNINYTLNKRFYIHSTKFNEIDIFLPDYNIGIEHNGLYWHSETNNKDVNYHLNKTIHLKSKGVNVIHIFEDEYRDKREIIHSMILSKCGIYHNRIYARKCELKEISSNDKKFFLEQNHIQGNCNSKINIGLFYDNQIVSIMTFGKRKINGSKKITWELMRYCSKLNTQIVGGANKLFSYFVNNILVTGEEIISYADKRFYFSDFYKKLNFIYSHT